MKQWKPRTEVGLAFLVLFRVSFDVLSARGLRLGIEVLVVILGFGSRCSCV